MRVPVLNMQGEHVQEIELRPDICEAPVNVPLMQQALVLQLANARQGTDSTKTRGENNRTTAKWYRQKGTGRARHGSRSANLFVGGGIAHGPKPRDYTKRMPREMRHAAVRSALSAKAAAPIGAAFTLICLITGSLWGRPMWGTYWVWDARLTSVFVLFLMYLGVIALWRTIEDPTRAGRVTAVLDWEVAHWGDAMEDLAAIAVRDMATPVGHLPTRFAEYATASGATVDLYRVACDRVLVLTRNAMLI